MIFGAEHCQGDFRMQGVLAKDALYLTFTGDGLRVMGNSPRFALNIVGPGTEVDASQSGEATFHGVFLRGSMLTKLLAGADAEWIAQRWLAPGLHRPYVSEVEAAWLNQLLTDLAGLIATVPVALLKPGSLQLAQDDVFAATRTVLASAEPAWVAASVGTASRRRALALAAEELIWSQPDQVLSLTSICDTLNTSVRTLQLAFQEQFGVGFQAFVRAVRLHQARSSIVRFGDRLTITEIATQHGFWQLGRFTQYYRQLFGCKPSETRRQIWGTGLQADHFMRRYNQAGQGKKVYSIWL